MENDSTFFNVHVGIGICLFFMFFLLLGFLISFGDNYYLSYKFEKCKQLELKYNIKDLGCVYEGNRKNNT